MRLFAYYALHTFKNQLKKLFKTWVLIFFAVCVGMGVALGLFMAFLDDSAAQADGPGPADTVVEEGPSFLEAAGVAPNDVVELAVGGVVLAMFVFYAMSADKNGSRIFLPADVNLLFASPMKPQSVLLFRVATQLGIAVVGSVYLLLQLPNLVLVAGLSLWAALALVAAWGLTLVFGTLLQVLLYTLASTHPAVKRLLRPCLYGLLLLTAGGFAAFAAHTGTGLLNTAVRFFNAPLTRYIPVWGWLKGLCAFALAGNAPGAVLCLLALVLAGAALIYGIWNLRADFYEDALAKSEETAALLEKAQAERSTGIAVKRKKDRSETLRRDGMRHGAGANVFFFKALYNRFRFAHLGFFTKTMETYLVAAVAVALLCRFAAPGAGLLPVALTLAAMAFFRALGNPLEQDTQTDCFRLIPESTWAKLFWSLMGGTLNCLLDVLPAILVGAALTGFDFLGALVWVPLIVSVDFYATCVGAFIGLSVPVAAGQMLKQVVQIMFVYFGLVPDIAAAALGIVLGHTAAGMLAAAVLNFGLGFLFFGLAPMFIDPHGGIRKEDTTVFMGDLKLARRQFSAVGLGLFTIMAVGTVLQLAAGAAAGYFYPQGGPSWLLWLCTFAPMYLVAVPVGLLVLRRAPAAPREEHALRPGQFAAAGTISVFAMYAGNLAGNLLLMLLQAVTGAASVNPLLPYAMDEALLPRVLVMVVLAPLIEEYIFRKQIIDRTCVYGEKLAVVTSAVLFGLFHGNLSQFFYAFVLGLVFGYIYLRTGRLRYSAALHMGINFLGGVVAPALLGGIDLEAVSETEAGDAAALQTLLPQLLPLVAYALALVAVSLVGLVLFCFHIRDIRFRPAPQELPKGARLKTVYANVGMVLFIALCLASVALTFLAA